MADEPSLYDLWSTYSLAVIHARITALEGRVTQLEADLAHARHWANHAIDHPALEIGNTAADQARAYCDASEHFTARDGWFIGQPVASASAHIC